MSSNFKALIFDIILAIINYLPVIGICLIVLLPILIILRRKKHKYFKPVFSGITLILFLYIFCDSYEYFHYFAKKSSAIYHLAINEVVLLGTWIAICLISSKIGKELEKRSK